MSTIRVTFYSVGTDKEGNRIPLAYGADRTPLHWCIDRAIKTGKPFVELASPSDFIRELGQGDSGANYKRIREAFNRIMSLCITVERFGNDGEQNRTIIPIIEHSHLPATLQPGATPIDGPLGFRLAPAFFAEALKHHAPFPTSLLRDLATKPQAQDYILFLNWRSFAAKTTTVIPWKMLREQLWQDDTNAPRIRLRFEQAIEVLKIAWPELNAVATSKGLLIGPPSKGQHLFPAYRKETKLS